MKTKFNYLICLPILIVTISLFISGCKKDDEEKNSPIVTTDEITGITATSVQLGGTVITNNGFAVTSQGICWGTNETPTINDSKVVDGTNASSFTANISDLQANTKYYVRAYAANANGVGYGITKSFLTLNGMVSISTAVTTGITSTSATSGGTASDDGGANITARGVVWSTTQNPTIVSNQGITTNGTGNGSYTSNLTGLTQNTTYYIRAYATNSIGTFYGNQETFKTVITDGPGETITDIDGNVYNTIWINGRQWMKENLRTTKYNDGTSIQLITDNTAWYSLTTPAYCWYNNDQAANGNTYGALYNWHAVNTGKLCPAGWHIPSATEWNTLITELGGESVAGGKLKETGTTHWNNPNTGATNESGFTALPGGYRTNSGIPSDLGNYSAWWTSTEFGEKAASKLILNYSASILSDSYDRRMGFSVRCVKD